MIFYLSILAIFLSIMVAINNWSINRGSIFLSILLIFISIFSLHQYALTGQGSVFWLALMHINFASTWYLIGPLLLWYTRSLISDEVRFYKTDLLHLIPFIIHFLGSLPYIFSSFEYKEWVASSLLNDLTVAESIPLNWLIPLKVNVIARGLLVLLYGTYCTLKFIRHFRDATEINTIWKNQGKNIKRWFFSFVGILMLIVINNLIGAVEFVFLEGTAVKLYSNSVTLINSILVAGFPMVLIAFPDILYGLPRKISTGTNQHSESIVKEKKLFTDSEQNYFSELADRIKYYFENEKPFLSRDFSFDDLVSHINAPRHHIYFCLNSVIEKKFVALKNSYRISHAKTLLMEMNFDKYTIESVSLKCGFASRSNFYSVFKEETGITPTEFLAQNDRRETQLI